MTGPASGALPALRGLSRRDLLVGGAAALVVAAAAPRLVGTLTSGGGPDWERTLVRSAFVELLGTSFLVTDAAGGELRLELAEVSDLPWSGAPALHEGQFVASFTGPADRSLDQATYQVRNLRFGTFPLFLVPTRPAADGSRRYEAVFNRI
jgi:hypothetical protein